MWAAACVMMHDLLCLVQTATGRYKYCMMLMLPKAGCFDDSHHAAAYHAHALLSGMHTENR